MAARTKPAQADEAASDEELSGEEQLAANLGRLEIHESGAALDPEHPNYKQLKRIEDLRVKTQRARLDAVAGGSDKAAEIDQIKLDTEEAGLMAELKAAQNAAKAAKGKTGADGILESVQAQRDAAQAAADAASSEGN